MGFVHQLSQLSRLLVALPVLQNRGEAVNTRVFVNWMAGRRQHWIFDHRINRRDGVGDSIIFIQKVVT